MFLVVHNSHWIDFNSSSSWIKVAGTSFLLKNLPTQGSPPDLNFIVAPSPAWPCTNISFQYSIEDICGGIGTIPVCKFSVFCTPTPTATFTPNPVKPKILVAGYLDTYIESSLPGTLKIYAVSDQYCSYLELFYGGMPTGINLNEVDPDVYSFVISLDAGAAQGIYVFELLPSDYSIQGYLWPYFTVD